MINHSSIQKFVLASVCWLALASAQAQTADGTVVISGQLSTNTCKVRITPENGSSTFGVTSVDLGTISNSSSGAGQLLGTQVKITFQLTNSTGTTLCAIGDGKNSWNIVLDLQANQVDSTSVPGKPFLTNKAATNAASNIGVALFSNDGTQFTALATGAGYLGTAVWTPVFNTTLLSMRVQFMATSASAPTSGLFSATVPLLLVYN